MKFSELSYREYIALEVLPVLADKINAQSAVAQAFLAADAFLKECGKENDNLAAAKRRAEKAETSVSILLNMNEEGNFTPRVALLQIWEFLGVEDQAAAMQKLCDMAADAL